MNRGVPDGRGGWAFTESKGRGKRGRDKDLASRHSEKGTTKKGEGGHSNYV